MCHGTHSSPGTKQELQNAPGTDPSPTQGQALMSIPGPGGERCVGEGEREGRRNTLETIAKLVIKLPCKLEGSTRGSI